MEKSSIKTHRTHWNTVFGIVRFIGVWTYEKSYPVYLRLFNSSIRIFSASIVTIYFSTILADLIVNYKNLNVLSDDGCFLCGVYVILFKAFKYHRFQNRINRLYDEIHEPIDLFRQSCDPGVLITIKKAMLLENLDFYMFSSFAMTLGLSTTFFVPRKKGELPVRALFPFDTKTSPMHEIAFFIQIYSIAFALTNVVTLEFIGLGFIRWTTVQLIILTWNYKNCRTDVCKRDTFDPLPDTINMINNFGITKLNNQPVVKKFVPLDTNPDYDGSEDCYLWRFQICIKHHQKLTWIVKELNSVFSSSMMTQLATSATMICLAGFQAVLGSNDKSSFMKFTVYLGATFTQLLYWCWFSNQLLYQAISLTTGIWMSGWEHQFPLNVKNLLTISMLRTLKPLQLKAGNFFTLSLETFVSILKSSYSFFALLSSTTQQNLPQIE
ncbi:hypothetical protein KQX54_004314 [Cotesia glomerata]|uniref:Odorant receptor n=1 Tax=Cotesia glomerata TaxID=32391 RepID=A0AAV7ICN2_COTGL|nr:hypothetical protein KQX54_004314 [Cotesia glomerata]